MFHEENKHMKKMLLLLIILIPILACSPWEERKARKSLEKMGIEYNKAAFFDAVEKENTEAVRLFLNSGFDPNFKDENGKTLLMYAAEMGHIGVSQLLMQAEKDVNIRHWIYLASVLLFL